MENTKSWQEEYRKQNGFARNAMAKVAHSAKVKANYTKLRFKK